jgi:pseudouridine kinase
MTQMIEKGISAAPTGDLAVVGGANYDITGVALGEANFHDSNPSRVYTGCGGVGRNIAENAGRLGLKTALLAAFGTDAFAEILRASCETAGVDTRLSHVTEGARSGLYIDLLDQDGELLLAASDQGLIESLPLDAIRATAPALSNYRFLCLDANLTEEAVHCAAETIPLPIIGDTVSMAKAVRFRGILHRIYALKTNLLELSALTEQRVDAADKVEAAAETLLKNGVSRIFVTMGPEGACCVDSSGITRIAGFPAEVRNVTGAGDAFCAGIACGLLRGLSNEEILYFSTAMSHLAMAGESAVNPQITAEKVAGLAEALARRVTPL